MKEVWIVKGCVGNPEVWHDCGYPDVKMNDVEWQFSDGPAGNRGGSDDYISLEEGLKEHDGCIINWDMGNDLTELVLDDTPSPMFISKRKSA